VCLCVCIAVCVSVSLLTVTQWGATGLDIDTVASSLAGPPDAESDISDCLVTGRCTEMLKM